MHLVTDALSLDRSLLPLWRKLAAAADAVVLEAPFYGSEDVLLAAAALLAPAASTALTARRSGKVKMLRSSKPPKLVLAGDAKDLYLDRSAGAACGRLAARGRAAAELFRLRLRRRKNNAAHAFGR